MKKEKKYKCRHNWERLILTALVGAVFCGFLLVATWQFQSDQEIMFNTEMTVRSSAKNDSIKVIAPKANDQIKSPVQVSGQAAVFEAQLHARIKDNSGLILAEAQFVTREGQTMSPFSTKIKYKKPSRNKGTIEIFEKSPKDGAEIHKISIPVVFQD